MRTTLCSMARNVWLVYVVRGLTFSGALIVPNLVLYLRQYQISLEDFFLMEAVFAATLLVAQLPAGAFADRFGRRFAILAGSAALPLSMLLYVEGTVLSEFLLAEMLGALGYALVSGPAEALLHDSLRVLKRTTLHTRLWGRAELCGFLAMAAGNVVGGLLATLDGRLPFLTAAAAFASLGLFALSLQEPVRLVKAHVRMPVASVVRTCLFERSDIRWAMLFPAVLTASMQASFWMYPDYFLRSGIDASWNGWLFASFQLVAGACSRMASRAEKRYGFSALSRTAVFFTALGFAAMAAFSWAGAPLLILFHQVVRGYLPIILSGYLNKHVPRHARATALGLRGLCFLLVYTGLLFATRRLVALVDLQVMFAVFAAITLAGGGLGLLLRPKEQDNADEEPMRRSATG